jgi:hypothetical protein
MLQRLPNSPSRAELKALRDRRHRERLRLCRIVVPVEVCEEVLGLVLRLHWLAEHDATDREKIGAAIAAMLRASAAA